MKNLTYWAQRQRMLEEVRHKQNTEYLKQLDKAFAIERRNIENQILSWYERLANNNGVSLAEAKRMLSAKELKEFRWTVEEYIKYGQENAINQQWLKELENASAKAHIDRLKALEIELGQKVEQIYHEYGKDVEGLFTGQMKDLYTEASKISGVDLAFDTRKVKSVLSKPWTSDGKTFSERIWGKKVKLHNHLHTELTRMCITGETPKRVIKNLAEKFNVEMHQAKTLVNTESAYFASTTQKQIYDDLDVEKYEILAEVDERTSDICLNLNGHVFDAKDFEPGVTAPPFHPNCRTITAPWFSEDEDEGPLPDIYVGRSIGAAALNYDILLPDGNIAKLKENSRIRKVVVFAGKGTTKPVKVAKFLEAEYGVPASEWKKVRGEGVVAIGEGKRAELHWYESDSTGIVKMKVKRFFE